jgi:hypothetical protein
MRGGSNVHDAIDEFLWVAYRLVGGEQAKTPMFDETGVRLHPKRDAQRAFGTCHHRSR